MTDLQLNLKKRDENEVLQAENYSLLNELQLEQRTLTNKYEANEQIMLEYLNNISDEIKSYESKLEDAEKVKAQHELLTFDLGAQLNIETKLLEEIAILESILAKVSIYFLKIEILQFFFLCNSIQIPQ